MFKSAASKLAHSATVPSLGGNKDLRTLQNLITAEKSVLQSVQKLSIDLSKASESLKLWGNGEGVDLGDVLTASTMLTVLFSEALSVYANHEITIRGHMKSIRTREESLDELKQRRKALGSRADSAEKKLAKMNPEHKQLQAQRETLARLQEDMRNMDADIMNQEAQLLDFKRYFTKTFMGLKFGGLQELCDKGLILAEHGKMVIAEIPMEPTQPGFPRPPYTGNGRTEQLVTDAQRLTQSVLFSEGPVPSVSATIRPASVAPPSHSPQSAVFQQHAPPGSPPPQSPIPPHEQQGADFRKLSLGPEFSAASVNLPYLQPAYGGQYPPQQVAPPVQPQPQQYPTYPFQGQMQTQPHPEVNEFGSYNSPNQFPARSNSVGPGGAGYYGAAGGPQGSSQFATLPAGAGHHPIYPGYLPEMGDRPPSLDVAPGPGFSTSVTQALGQGNSQAGPSSPTRSGTVSITYSKAKEGTEEKKHPESTPPPMYSLTADEKQNGKAGDAYGVGQHLASLDEDQPRLAYRLSDPPQGTGSGLPSPYDDRRVQFGGDQESGISRDPSMAASQITQASSGLTSSPAAQSQPLPDLEEGSPRHPALAPYHIPTPPQAESEDEHALNAAAAREVSRELDALMFTTPVGPRGSTSSTQAQFPQGAPLPQPPAAETQPPSMSYNTRDEQQYVRERYRSPTLQSSHSREGGVAADDNSHPQAGFNRTGNSPSPALSYRIPDDYTAQPGPPRPFYTHPTATGSASSLTPGDGPRKISAAAFKRARPQGSPVNLASAGGGPGDGSGLGGDVSPLLIQKRSSRNLQPGEVPGQQQRIGSAPGGPRYSPDPAGDGGEWRGRSVSGVQPSGDGSGGLYDDSYDYISAYANPAPNQ